MLLTWGLYAGEADICVLREPLAQDWTFYVGSCRFGLLGDRFETEIACGWSTFCVPVPFYGVVACAGFICAAGAFGVLHGRRGWKK